MARHEIDQQSSARDEDWVGNNAAFTCPKCGKVFLVSGFMHKGHRACPQCGESTGHVKGGKESDGVAYIEWT